MAEEKLDFSDEKEFRRLPYDLSGLRTSGLPRGFLLEDGNRDQAENEILRLNDIFRTAHKQNSSFPLTRIYSDDIRFDRVEGIPAELTSYLLPMPRYRRLNTDSWVLRLHFCLIPDEENKITGDIYYCADGEIDRINIYFDHSREHWFLQCVNDGKHLLLNTMQLTQRKKKRLYPILVIGTRPAALLCLTLVFLLGAGLFAWVSISGRQARENARPAAVIVQDAQTLPPRQQETSAPPPESLPAAQPETASPETAAEPTAEIALLSLTSPIRRGETALLAASCPPDSLCTIAVYYSSGKSQASGLEARRSDSSGRVEWTWKVSSRTKPGEYHIELSCEGRTISLPFTVTE